MNRPEQATAPRPLRVRLLAAAVAVVTGGILWRGLTEDPAPAPASALEPRATPSVPPPAAPKDPRLVPRPVEQREPVGPPRDRYNLSPYVPPRFVMADDGRLEPFVAAFVFPSGMIAGMPYTMLVSAKGTVRIDGDFDVDSGWGKPPHVARRVDVPRVERLVRDIVALGFLELKDVYDEEGSTDGTFEAAAVAADGVVKSVHAYSGDEAFPYERYYRVRKLFEALRVEAGLPDPRAE